MSTRIAVLLGSVALAAGPLLGAQNMTLPGTVTAGSAFTVQTQGSGNGTLFIVGPGQALKRDVQLGQAVFFAAGSLFNAGQYTVILTGNGPAEAEPLAVAPAKEAANLNFLARPSRLPVALHDGITGAVYVFDAYKNLITAPVQVTFDLTNPSGQTQSRTVPAKLGAAWTEMDSTEHQGNDKFVARIGSVASTRVIGQVPGDPCGLKMTASPAGNQIKLQTDPIRDCSGNAVPDGTIVTFTEAFKGGESTVDVPIKRGLAEVDMPAHPGAVITVASGVVLGNQIRWER